VGSCRSRQMLAASSRMHSSAGSNRRPTDRRAFSAPARSTASVNAATSGVGEPAPPSESRYSVSVEATNAAGANRGRPGRAGGVTQRVTDGSVSTISSFCVVA